MGTEVIMLAKNIDYKKLQFPVSVSEKLDGTAADFYVPFRSNSGDVLVRTRDDKPIYSVQHIQDNLKGVLKPGQHYIGELHIKGKPFKYISGKVRQHEPAEELKLRVYDFYAEGSENVHYIDRISHIPKKYKHFSTVDNVYIETEEALRKYISEFLRDHPDSEGVVVRSHRGKDSVYKVGRSWGLQRMKRQQTLDLVVVGFEEAVSKDGEPKGMVGRVNIMFNGNVSGVGPGKLTHAERIEIWNNRAEYTGKIAEVTAMVDPSYNALREGRFIRWRPDKTEPSEE